jgi:predicted acetyltransferase
MDKCVLIKPDLSFENEIEAFRKEMIEANSSMDGTGPLKQMSDIKEWLKYSQCCGNKEYVPENWVTCEQYIYVRVADNKIVGMIQFRHYLNEFLEKYGGHIGYSVRPSERRKGYARMNNYIHQKQLKKDFIEFYGHEYLKLVQSTLPDEGGGWLSYMVRKNDRTTYAIRYLLLTRFLGISVRSQ